MSTPLGYQQWYGAGARFADHAGFRVLIRFAASSAQRRTTVQSRPRYRPLRRGGLQSSSSPSSRPSRPRPVAGLVCDALGAAVAEPMMLAWPRCQPSMTPCSSPSTCSMYPRRVPTPPEERHCCTYLLTAVLKEEKTDTKLSRINVVTSTILTRIWEVSIQAMVQFYPSLSILPSVSAIRMQDQPLHGASPTDE